ncbi:hypothetical protein P1940_19210, partial [Xanthomonas perforans]
SISVRYGAAKAHSSSEISVGYGLRGFIRIRYRDKGKVHNTLYVRRANNTYDQLTAQILEEARK